MLITSVAPASVAASERVWRCSRQSAWVRATVFAAASLPWKTPREVALTPRPIPRARAETEVPVSSIPPTSSIRTVKMRAPTVPNR